MGGDTIGEGGALANQKKKIREGPLGYILPLAYYTHTVRAVLMILIILIILAVFSRHFEKLDKINN